MADTYRILVTGSRDWRSLDAIHDVLAGIQAAHPGHTFRLVHGQCDPRHPFTRKPVNWDGAENLAARHQAMLLGADWLADVAARALGWEVERHPADWTRFRRAGPERNDRMVSLGADEAHAFICRCSSPRCRVKRWHGSHGATGCADLAERAGIATERHAAGEAGRPAPDGRMTG